MRPLWKGVFEEEKSSCGKIRSGCYRIYTLLIIFNPILLNQHITTCFLIQDNNASLTHQKQLLNLRNQEYQELKRKYQELEIQTETYAEDGKRLEQYQAKFKMICEEIQRLNTVLKAKTQAVNTLNIALKESENNVNSLRQQNDGLRSNLTTIGEELSVALQKLQKTRSEMTSYEDIQVSLRKAEEQVTYYIGLKKEKDQIIQQLEDSSDKYQENTSKLGREVQRLNGVLKGKLEQINAIEIKLNRTNEEMQNYRNQLIILQKDLKQVKQLKNQVSALQLQLSNQQLSSSKLTQTNSDLMTRLNFLSLQNQKFSSFQPKLQKSFQQIKRLGLCKYRIGAFQNKLLIMIF